MSFLAQITPLHHPLPYHYAVFQSHESSIMTKHNLSSNFPVISNRATGPGSSGRTIDRIFVRKLKIDPCFMYILVSTAVATMFQTNYECRILIG